MCDTTICPRGCGPLKKMWNGNAMYFCPMCNAVWRHVDRDGRCGLIGTIPVGVGKETLTMCALSPTSFHHVASQGTLSF